MIPVGHQTIRSFILSCPTFVQKHIELGRTMAGRLHKRALCSGGLIPGLRVHPTYPEIPQVRQEFDNY